MPSSFGITRFFASKAAKQSGMLIGLQGVAMTSSFALTILIVRGLDVAEYGTFRYVMIFLALGMTLLQFGMPYSAARLLALEADPSVQKEIIGACAAFVALTTIVGIIVTLAVVFAAEALGYGVPQVLIWVAPALCVTLGQYMLGSVCQGLNRISVLSFQQVLPYVILVPATAIQLFLFHEYSLSAAIIGYVAAFFLVVVLGFFQLGVAFRQWQFWLRAMLSENRGTGFPIYVGGVFGVASAQLIAMWVADFADPVQYGQYALALAVSAPLGVLVSSVGTVIFRSSSRSAALSKKLLTSSFGLGGVLGLMFFVATEYLLVWAFGNEYSPAVQMAQLLGVASLMIGWGDIFQRFLGAHGLGKGLGMAATCAGLVGMITAAMLLHRWATYGAVVASLMAAVAYLGSMIGMYIYYTGRGAACISTTPRSG
jgi:O-antigen/teichoic acid export membrane protein